ncbi:PA2778 family cysteine peptidase [Halomonas denitrificans]|nr:PA2778 family cysteine peptidase [Halomonas denitrificans]
MTLLDPVRIIHRLAFATALVLLGGCATLDAQFPDGLDDRVDLADVPFHPQLDHHCGPAALMTVLGATGIRPEYDRLAERVYVPGLEGSLQVEMLAAARDFGRIPFRVPGSFDAVLGEVAAGRPVLILQNLRLRSLPAWHYAVVVGYDRPTERILMRSGQERTMWTPAGTWLRQWDWAGRWAAVVLPPGELPIDIEPASAFHALADFDEQADPVERAAAWQAAVERWPDSPIPRLGVGNAEFAAGRIDAAAEAFEHAIALQPDHWPARLNLALVDLERGLECAVRDRLEAEPLEPGHALSAVYEDALERARSACEAERSNRLDQSSPSSGAPPVTKTLPVDSEIAVR